MCTSFVWKPFVNRCWWVEDKLRTLKFRSAAVYSKYDLSVPPDIEERLKARMGDGRYQSEDDVLREAMDALDQLEQDKRMRWNERNQIAMRQSQQGLSKPLNDEVVLSRFRDRLAKEGIVD